MNGKFYQGKIQKIRIDIADIDILELSDIMVTFISPSLFKRVKRYHKIDSDNGHAILLVNNEKKKD